MKHEFSLNVSFLLQYKQNVHLERERARRHLPRLSDSQLAIRCQLCRYSENCTNEGKKKVRGLRSNDTQGPVEGAVA